MTTEPMSDADRAVAAELTRLGQEIDPTFPSLRDEVAFEIEPHLLHDDPKTAHMVAGYILDVVRRHIEALPKDHGGRDTWWVNFHDVLRLLVGEE